MADKIVYAIKTRDGVVEFVYKNVCHDISHYRKVNSRVDGNDAVVIEMSISEAKKEMIKYTQNMKKKAKKVKKVKKGKKKC